MDFLWREIPFSKTESKKLQQALNIQPVLCDLLIQRDICTFEEARNFFRPQLNQLHNPFLMKDMDKAVERIDRAIKAGETIMIYGDYDVDGTTAVSMFYCFLSQHYSRLETYIPDRYEEGYGISYKGIDYAADTGVSLIIALDCGIKAVEKIDYAREKGVDFIICDHHLPGNTVPQAAAVLDPKQRGCAYPYKELCGCGVGFKLIQALCEKWKLNSTQWEELLDFLAVSIGADMVPIGGENRILAHYGLKKINENPRPSFAQLKELAGKKDQQLSITDVVFMIAPRINAAGRISHGKLAVELLTSDNIEKVEDLSTQLNDNNLTRKDLDKEITAEALGLLNNELYRERKTTVVFNENWHKGVIGIVASRLIESHYKPTIVFTESQGKLTGSARSVKNFDIYNALEKCSDLLEQFGGHKYAAGLTMRKELLESFQHKFEEVVEREIKPEQLVPEIEIDAELSLEDVSWPFWKILKQFAPFGPGNMKPIFKTDNLLDTGYSKCVGKEADHLRLVLRDPTSGKTISGIGFGLADKIELVKSNQPLSVLYHLEENEFKGDISLQMMVKDIKPIGF